MGIVGDALPYVFNICERNIRMADKLNELHREIKILKEKNSVVND